MTKSVYRIYYDRYLPWIVWTLRVLLGAVFVVSGFAKAVDLWGTIYKIEEYLSIWNWIQPRSLVVVGAIGIASAEFTMGLMLMLGCYRRFVVWCMLATMAVMLPLTLYIYIENPVADCGCFGDLIKLSNGATFLKNILITVGLVYLLRINVRVCGIYRAFVQWASTALALIYILVICLFGYNIQPLLEFRSFGLGATVLPDENDGEIEMENEYLFRYEKDGQVREFSIENLPDSTWTFVDRVLVSGIESADTEFVIMDGDENVTSSVVDTDGEQLIIVVPQGSRADVSYTYLINELWRYMLERGGSLIEVAAIDSDHLDRWVDLSMAEYPVYSADGTMLKEFSRGDMSAVYLKGGKIVWKRTLGSIDVDLLQLRENEDVMQRFSFDGPQITLWLTGGLVAGLLLLLGISGSRTLFLIRKRLHGKFNAK